MFLSVVPNFAIVHVEQGECLYHVYFGKGVRIGSFDNEAGSSVF
jgi:hypothetical protein